jgi:hypothetical protein
MLEKAKSEGATIYIGGEPSEKGFFVHPAFIEARKNHIFIKTDIFVPLQVELLPKERNCLFHALKSVGLATIHYIRT